MNVLHVFAKVYRWNKTDVEELTINEINYLLQKIEQEQKELQSRMNR